MSKIVNSSVFNKLFNRLMKHEGGYVNHPSDPGGETNWGVTKRVARRYGYKGDMRKLPKETAKNITHEYYWQKVQADAFDPMVAWQLVDASYNHGIGNAIRFLQRAVGVADDGIIGQVTLGAVLARNPYEVVLLFNAERLAFYSKLSTFKVFGRGWARRVVGNLRYAVADASQVDKVGTGVDRVADVDTVQVFEPSEPIEQIESGARCHE